MKLIINEKQYNWLLNEMKKDVLSEMAYPTSFNFDEFRQCRSFAERVRYCEQRLQRIAQGSARIVYKVDDDKVLKLAKNQKGVAQNETEIRLGNEVYYTCFADVYEYDENGLWVEMEFCRKAKKSDFKAIYGVPFDVICCMMHQQKEGWVGFNPYDQYSNVVKQIWDGEETDLQMLFMSIQEYIGCEMLEGIGDLCRISSWGIDSEGYFKLVDYGVTDEIFDKYYKKW